MLARRDAVPARLDALRDDGPQSLAAVATELDHGGLKVCIDHGEGLFTTHNHLSRALVRVGERVSCGSSVIARRVRFGSR